MRNRKTAYRLKSKLTTPQLEALIPAGPVAGPRKARDEIEIEVATESDAGSVLVTRQRVPTPVSRLLKAGAISLQEAQAAQLFKFDHDSAYTSCVNVLAAIHVDNSGGNEGLLKAKLRQAKHGQRFRAALVHLRSELGRVALMGIISTPENKIQGLYQALGYDCLPNAARPEQSGGGKAALVLAIRELAIFYGYRTTNLSRASATQTFGRVT